MNVVASAPEGLEKSLAEEISNLGGFNINTYKRFINFECDYATFYLFEKVESFQTPCIIWLIRLI